jgi:2'-5' RNA ligase
LFFALWPDETQQEALARATRAVVQACGGRAVPTRNFHLTLAFLGSVPERRIPQLMSVAHRVAGEFPPGSVPLRLTFERCEYWRKPQILCATASEESAGAAALADNLKRALVEAGFAPDLKPFRAHVTLARKVGRGPRDLGIQPVSWSFDGFALVDSRTEPDGPLYSVLDSWLLAKPPTKLVGPGNLQNT